MKLKSKNIFLIMMAATVIASIIFFVNKSFGPLEKGNSSVLVFFIVTAAIGFYFFIDLFRNLRKTADDIESALEFLEGDHSNDISDRMTALTNNFRENSLNDLWNEFKKTIRVIEVGHGDDGEVKKEYFTTLEANYYFNEDVILGNINSKMHNYVPQLLTAIGIFGTFLGLVSGLKGLDLTNVEGTKSSIKILIAGVSVSFKSSLYGVLYSILLTSYQKIYLGDLQNKMSRVALKIDMLFPKNTQQDGIRELQVQLETQTSALQRLATDFAEEMGKKFDSSLQEKLGPSLIKLADTTEMLANMSQNTNESAIHSLINNVHNVLSNAADQEINNLKNSLSEITSKNEFMFEKFASAMGNLESLMENQKSIITETNSSAGNIGKTNEKIENLAYELQSVLSHLGQFSQTQQVANDDYRSLLGEIKEHIDYQKQANSLTSNVIKENMSSLEMQKSIYQDLSNTVNKLNTFNENIGHVMERVGSNIKNFDEMSASINNKFVNTFTKLEEFHKAINESIGGSFESLDLSVNRLKDDVLKNLNSINKEFIDVSKQLNEFTDRSAQVSASLDEFSSTQSLSHELWKTYRSSFEELNKEIKGGVNDYTISIKSGLQNIFSQYEENIVKILGKFNDTINELNDNIQELSEVFENAK